MKFPKDIIDCMRDCILSIFWPKEDIISFFKNNGCTARDLKNVMGYKEQDLSRAKIIDIVFNDLHSRDDEGLGQYRSMLQALLNWDFFDSYYFNTLKKLNEKEARRKLTHLSQLQEIRDAKIKEQQAAKKFRDEKKKNSRKSLSELQKIFSNLYQGKDENGQSIDLPKRGYLFEGFLQELVRNDSIPVTESIRLVGEQIDGALKYDGENYIIEAKWHDSAAASNALYHFAHKVEGKMYGRGLFISINGFSSDSVQALVKGKAIKTVLIDGGDLSIVTEGLLCFSEMLDRKVSAAQTKGLIYIDALTGKEKIID